MILYSDSTSQFILDTSRNIIADKLSNSFQDHYGRKVSPSEVGSWVNSLQFLRNLLEEQKLTNNNIVLEFELPYTSKRIDCILFGKGIDNSENVVIIELKQWSTIEDCDIDGNVVTFVGRDMRMVPHPSIQVEGYHFLLQDFISIFDERPELKLSSCAYLHNYKADSIDVLNLPKFSEVVKNHPLFNKLDFDKIGNYLKEKLSGGDGNNIFGNFKNSSIRPSKKLLEHAHQMIQGHKAFSLVDEQITANNTILDRAKKSFKNKHKTVIIIKGGPGTGKSLIALNVLAELASKNIKVFHATGSGAFTKTLRRIVGVEASSLFKYFLDFPETKVSDNEIDVLICDESHRIRKSGNFRYTPKQFKSELPQVETLVKAAKVSVFFIDDRQIVRPDEIGNSLLIKDTALEYGADIFEFELKSQFRCSGSDGFLNWIENTLQIEDTANLFLTKEENMEFKIFDSPQELYSAILEKNSEKPNSARLVAGFCWPWSNPNSDGTLVEDVTIGEFKMPWEGKEGKKLAKGIPQWQFWAYDPNGVNQIGCIYTIQGFEFDYVGIIVGNDLVYDSHLKEWVGKPNNSYDPAIKGKGDMVEVLKNTYRTLFSRAHRGCYVYFVDHETRKYFESRIQK